MRRPRKIYLLVLPRVHLLDLAAPGQVFAHDQFAGQVSVHYISPQTELCSAQGLHLEQLEPLPEQIDKDDWLMLIGSKQLHRHLHEAAYRRAIQWLRDKSSEFALVAGICSGTLLAGRLLEQTALPLDDIAARCGFSAERSLRRSWARWRQGTPGEYRRGL
jgi:transcriptional regulator GlxA family with amidase domain